MKLGRELPAVYHSMYGWFVWQVKLPCLQILPHVNKEGKRKYNKSEISSAESISIVNEKSDQLCNTAERLILHHVVVLIKDEGWNSDCRQRWSCRLTPGVHSNVLIFYCLIMTDSLAGPIFNVLQLLQQMLILTSVNSTYAFGYPTLLK